MPVLNCEKIAAVLRENDLLAEYSPENVKCVTDISHDSRSVTGGSLFFCKGLGFKAEYLADAVKRGAVCYVAEKKYQGIAAACFVVKNVRFAVSLIAPLFFGYPRDSFALMGITGTKGKTTVATFLHNIMSENVKKVGGKCAYITTTETYTGKRREESHLSTPEPCDLQRCFYEAADSGIRNFVMEVSSQAYKTGRVRDIKFDLGAFLNISEDHISPLEHSNFNDYLDCKLEFLRNCRSVLINSETDCRDQVLSAASDADEIVLFGSEANSGLCDYYYGDVIQERGCLKFTLKSEEHNYFENFEINMTGLFNAENAAAAAVCAVMRGIPAADIRAGLKKTEIAGRMNIFEGGGVTVVVDYAHNKLSFTKLFESLNMTYGGRRIISVGGAPGNKAFARRRDFAEIAGANSDYLILTAEDPQFESVEKICEEIAGYLPHERYRIIPDRAAAVTAAINEAKAGDVIVLLAKGEETYQKVNGAFLPYESDIKIAARLMNAKFTPAGGKPAIDILHN